MFLQCLSRHWAAMRQAASLTKEAEVIKAVRKAAQWYSVRHFADLPETGKAALRKAMARVLQINVLEAFHTTKPPSMPRLYQWRKGQDHIELASSTPQFLRSHAPALETIANYHWADFLETTNRLAPRIIQKVKRDSDRRRSLVRYLKILMDDGDGACFYCGLTFDERIGRTIDHVIPWSFIVDDPLWDLVLACARCNASKSDALPNRRFIDQLITHNARRRHRHIAGAASFLLRKRKFWGSMRLRNPWSGRGRGSQVTRREIVSAHRDCSFPRFRRGFGVLFDLVSCFDIFPPRDPENVTREESQQLLDHARQIYRSDTGDDLGHVAAPIAVTVSGKTAQLVIAHSMDWGHLEYAQAWHEIYQEHHGATPCLTLLLIWKGGHMDQHFPPDWTL